MRYLLLVTAGVALAGLGVGRASAQQPGSVPRSPSYSPYLNLLRQGNTPPGVNYYGLVRPELQARQSLLSLQSQVNANSQAIGGVTAGLRPPTDKVVGFMNYGGYFQNFNPAGGAGGGLGFGTLGGSAGGRTGAGMNRSSPTPRR